jgi:hypothetical protein
MSHWNRFLYAFALSVCLMMIIGLFAMIFEINIVPMVLNGTLFVPLLIVSYLIAPVLARLIRRS